jgi:hypothetical protein
LLNIFLGVLVFIWFLGYVFGSNHNEHVNVTEVQFHKQYARAHNDSSLFVIREKHKVDPKPVSYPRVYEVQQTPLAPIPSSFVSRGERETGRALHDIFPHRVFQSQIRPDWLANDYPGRRHPVKNLELDFYCEEERLGVDYHGPQHREVVPDFHPKGEKSLWAQKQRDKKNANCAGCTE